MMILTINEMKLPDEFTTPGAFLTAQYFYYDEDYVALNYVSNDVFRLTDTLIDFVKEYYQPSKVRVVPLGVDDVEAIREGGQERAPIFNTIPLSFGLSILVIGPTINRPVF